MPVINRKPAWERSRDFDELVAELANELSSPRDKGQPRIEEFEFPSTGALRVTVFWDKWDKLSDEARTAIILDAYERAKGKAARQKIALPIGLTYPEAYEAGLLPFQILCLLRKGDPVKREDCLQAMLDDGASQLFSPGGIQLRFATTEEAEDARKRLIAAVSGSDEVWAVTQDIGHMSPNSLEST